MEGVRPHIGTLSNADVNEPSTAANSQTTSMATQVKGVYRPRKRKKQKVKLDPLSKSLGADSSDTFFVPYQPPGSARRDIELVDAARRSYTARRWYRQHESDAPHDAPVQQKQRTNHHCKPGRRKSTSLQKHHARDESDKAPSNRQWTSCQSVHDPIVGDAAFEQQDSMDHIITISDPTCLVTDYNEQDKDNEYAVEEQPSPAWPVLKTLGFLPSGPYIIDADAANAIDYFDKIWAEHAFQSAPAHGRRGKMGSSEKALVVHTAMNDDLLAHAFLAAVVMRMATINRTQTSAERHANVALSKLRQCLKEGIIPEDRLVLPILFLAAYEIYCYNIEGTRTHLKALQKLRAQKQLSGYFKTLCRNIDLFSASSSLVPPILEDSTPPKPSPAAPVDSAGHFAEYLETLGPSLLTTITKIRALALRVEDVRNSHTSSEAAEDEQGTMEIVARSEELTYELLDNMPGTPLKECCIIALLMWLSYLPASIISTTNTSSTTTNNNNNNSRCPSNDFLKIIPGRGTFAVNRLKQCPLSTSLELWILAVGVVCAVDQDDVEYCATNFAQLAEKLCVFNVRQALRQFLWLDNFDLIDEDVLTQLLDPETVEGAVETVVGWATQTRRGNSRPTVEEKARCVRLTNRPSNYYRLGA